MRTLHISPIKLDYSVNCRTEFNSFRYKLYNSKRSSIHQALVTSLDFCPPATHYINKIWQTYGGNLRVDASSFWVNRFVKEFIYIDLHNWDRSE